MTIHRRTTQMGRERIVGTTLKQAANLPKDVVADEKHRTLSGETGYLATTVAEQWFFGASVSGGAGAEEFIEAYRPFQREAQHVQPGYQPETVNTDGGQATMKAWRRVFPTICLMPCFLHALLRLRNVATTATNALYDIIIENAWEVYAAQTKRSDSQRLRRLREWGETLLARPLKTTLLKRCEKNAGFLPAYDFPGCLRTSNRIDRLMRGMDKYLFAHQDVQGTLISAEYGIRSSCLLSNVRPSRYHPIAGVKSRDTRSPFAQLNGLTYHECWLQNMLIATSRHEMYRFQHKKLG